MKMVSSIFTDDCVFPISLGIHSYTSTYTHLQKLTARQLHYPALKMT